MITKRVSNFLVLAIPLLIVSFLFLLTKSEIFQQSTAELSFAITLDFLITIPLLYAVLIWNKNIPKFTIVTAFILCVIAASYVLPENQQELLARVKFIAIPVLEIGIFSFIVYKIRKLSKSMAGQDHAQLDFYDKLQLACADTFPGRVGAVFATEMAVIRYALFPPKKKELKTNEFSYYKKSGITSIIGVLLGLVVVEVSVVHLIVSQSNETLAWILTGISLYAFVQIFSMVRSLPRRHITIDSAKQVLHLRFGFFAQVSIPFTTIDRIEKNKKSLPTDKSIIKLSTLDILDSHNTIIHLKESLTLEKAYGMRKEFTAIAIFLDKQEEFITQMGENLD